MVIVSNADAKVEAPEDAKPNKIDSERGTPRSTRRLVAQPENKRNTIPENAPREQNGKRASILKVMYLILGAILVDRWPFEGYQAIMT